MEIPTLSPCPVCGEEPVNVFVTRYISRFRCYGPHGDAHGGAGAIAGEPSNIGSKAVASWNEAVASYCSPAPEPEPVTPRRWWRVTLYAPVGFGGVACKTALEYGDTRESAIERVLDKLRENTSDGAAQIVEFFRDRGRGAIAHELTPAALATMLTESRAWYARELERSGEAGE